MLLDKYPIKRTIICIALISLFAQTGILLMFYFQCSGYKIFIFIFRGIFGVAGEGLYTIQALLISLYGGKHYDMLMGVCICTPFLFSSINDVMTPTIYNYSNSMELIWGIGAIVCLISLIAALMISRILSIE
jgi:hypothetical protein